MLRILELYCGIGGLSAALDGVGRVVAALDLNTRALDVYRANFVHPARACNLDSISQHALGELDAQLWWLSAPCQPFTRRGLRRDAEDPRARSFLHLIDRIGEVRPPWIALENVPGFQGSRVHEILLGVLATNGYAVTEHQVCPSDLGVPNRRRRYYLVASRQGPPRPLEVSSTDPQRPEPLSTYLDAVPEPGLDVDPEFARRYARALHVVEADDPDAVTACFTSAYGRSRVRSGSYVAYRQDDGTRRVRRLSPQEVLRLLEFPQDYRLPPDLPRELAWRLVGNSLSLRPVRRVLATVHGLEELGR